VLNLRDPSLEVLTPPVDVSDDSLPMRFRGLGAYWYYTQLLDRLWRPTRPAKLFLDLLEDGMGMRGTRTLCAFIPKCRPSAEADEKRVRLGGCAGSHEWLDKIMPAVGEVAMRYNISTVLLVTDSLRAVAATSKYEKLAFKHLRFHNSSGALSRLKHGAPSAPAVEWLGGTRFREPLGPADFTPQWALDLVAHHPDLEEFASIEFMSRCDAFVGPLADEMMRLAYQLAVARKGWFPPFVSNDGPLLHAQPPPSLED